MRERIKRELLDGPQPSVGKSTLVVGFIFVLIWLSLLYIQPEQLWLNSRFLIVAICFVCWGVADVLPRRLRVVAVVLRGAVLVFLIGFGAWILIDLIRWITAF